MTKEEFVAKAYRDYPIGTLYIPTRRGSRQADISTGEFTFFSGFICDKELGTSIYDERKNKWAEIINESSKISFNYLIL